MLACFCQKQGGAWLHFLLFLSSLCFLLFPPTSSTSSVHRSTAFSVWSALCFNMARDKPVASDQSVISDFFTAAASKKRDAVELGECLSCLLSHFRPSSDLSLPSDLSEPDSDVEVCQPPPPPAAAAATAARASTSGSRSSTSSQVYLCPTAAPFT